MAIRLAFAGFRHFHILDLYEYARDNNRIEIIASAEDHSDTAKEVCEKGVTITHASIDELFANAESFDAVAIGDYYARRGALAIRALETGKHVILDKPVCTELSELHEIDSLRREKGLVVGCMLNNRDNGQFITLKRLIGEGTIGDIHTISFLGHHPLMYGERASWYFEPGKHGGTINDIAIHAIDLLPWLTGKKIENVVAARTWNSRLPECPDFEVCGQIMLSLEGGTGVLGDVSYLSPDSQGYTVPQYWRYTVHGSEGILETGMNDNSVHVWRNGEDSGRSVEANPDRDGGVFEDFLNEIEGDTHLCDLTTDQVLASARRCLEIQAAAGKG